MSRRVVVGGVRAAGLAELAEEGPLQRPERGSGLGEDPIVEVEPWCFLDGALVRWRGGIAHRRRRGPFCGGARCRVRLGSLVAALAFRMGSRRVAGGLLIGRRRPWRARPGWNLTEICGRGSRPGVAQARKTDLARRARAVSESGVGRAGACALRA